MTAGDDRTGLLFALAGFALLSFGDAVVKTMVDEWPASAIAALRYAIGAIGLSALLLVSEGRAAFAMPRPRIHLLRGLCVAGATLAFFSALFFMPLDEATTITFLSPVLTALLAPLLLGERSRIATWVACGAAFAGVLIVLRPSFADLGAAAFLPLLAALGMSLLVMANRFVAGAASALAMQVFVACFGALFLIAAALAGHLAGIEAMRLDWPTPSVAARCALVAVTASSAHWLVYLGTTRAGAATIAPMTYVQLLVAIALGWAFFGDMPDAMTLLGGAIIIGAGLFLWRRGRVAQPGMTD